MLRFQRRSAAVLIPADLIRSSGQVRVASDVAKLEAQSKEVLAQLPGAPPLVALTVLRGVRSDVPITPLAAVQRAAAAMKRDAALPPRKFRVAVRLGRHMPRDVKYTMRFCASAVRKAATQDGAAAAAAAETEAAATAHGTVGADDDALGYLLTLQLVDATGESFMYRYILRESCSQFDSLPLTYLTIPSKQGRCARLCPGTML